MDANGVVAAAPARVIGGSVLQNNTGLRGTFALALGSADVILASNQGDAGMAASVTVYSPDANGNVAPARVITGPASGLVKPLGIAGHNPLNILVANWIEHPDSSHASAVLEFSADPATGTPIGSLSGSSTGITAPAAVLIDSQSRVLVSEPAANRILTFNYRPSTQFNQSPAVTIAGPATLLDRPTGMAMDSAGNLYVANLGNGSITVYAAGASGNVAPVRRLGGPAAANSQLTQPYGVAVDSGGRIFVTQGNTFMVFAAGANGNQAPVQVISDSHLNYTTGIVVR
jgi:hypothetical protein